MTSRHPAGNADEVGDSLTTIGRSLRQANQKVLSDEEQYRQKFDAAYAQIDDANKKIADAASPG